MLVILETFRVLIFKSEDGHREAALTLLRSSLIKGSWILEQRGSGNDFELKEGYHDAKRATTHSANR